MPGMLEHLHALSAAVGALPALNILARRAVKSKKVVVIRKDGRPLHIRPCDSDLFVLGQIFGSCDYKIDGRRTAALRKISGRAVAEGKTPVIVDGGANVGFSSIYFAEQFSDAVVLAVEPDNANFELLRKNTSGTGRILPLHGAIWKDGNGVNLSNSGAASWARTVSDGGLTPSFTLDTLLDMASSASFPLILKLDIEGAEAEAITAAPGTVRAFPCVVAEPHDFLFPGRGCLAPLYTALAGKSIDTIVRGENVFFFDNDVLE